jgi:hypothetical protein
MLEGKILAKVCAMPTVTVALFEATDEEKIGAKEIELRVYSAISHIGSPPPLRVSLSTENNLQVQSNSIAAACFALGAEVQQVALSDIGDLTITFDNRMVLTIIGKSHCCEESWVILQPDDSKDFPRAEIHCWPSGTVEELTLG